MSNMVVLYIALCYLAALVSSIKGEESVKSGEHVDGNRDDLLGRLLQEQKDLRTKYEELLTKSVEQRRLLDKQVNNMAKDLQELRDKYDDIKNHLSISEHGSEHDSQYHKSTLRRASDTFRIGFTARLTTNLSNLGRYQTIKFDEVLLNNGAAYNPNTGIFTCTHSGMYVFFSNVLEFPGKMAATEIVRNGKNVASMYSANTNYYGNGCNMAVIQVNEGDTVWTRVYGNYHSNGTEIDSYYTTFSGFLIG